MDEVVKSSVSTEAMSWYRRTEAAPLSRAPVLLKFICLSSPASRLIRITLRALHGGPIVAPLTLLAILTAANAGNAALLKDNLAIVRSGIVLITVVS